MDSLVDEYNNNDIKSEDENSLLAGLTNEWNHNEICNGTDKQAVLTREEGYRSSLNPELVIHILSCRVQGIAFQLWPAARSLCEYIQFHAIEFTGKTCIELGSGCGLVGLLCASTVIAARKTLITDMKPVEKHLQANIEANLEIIPYENKHEAVAPKTLEWGKPIEQAILNEIKQFDYILLSDCVYWEELFDPLLCTLIELTDFSPRAVIYLSQTPRRGKIENRFFKKLKKKFDCVVVDKQKQNEECRQFVHIYKITRKLKV
jgi:predicted nicotinamide N-methyase